MARGTKLPKLLSLSFLFLTLLTIIGCSGGPEQGGFTPPPTPVETATVSAGVVTDRFSAVGTIEAQYAVTIVSELDALVKSVPFREGTAVGRGTLIAQLDDEQLLAQEARAKALADQQQINFDRTKKLFESRALPQQELDNAEALLKVAQADLALVQARLGKTRITAPFDGILGARQVSPGTYLRAGDPITNLTKLSQLRIYFSAPERYLADLQVGSPVVVSTPAFADYQLSGKVDVIEPSVNPNTRSVNMIALVDNPEGRLRPGMSVNVSTTLDERQQAITVSDEAVFAEGNESLVYVINADSTVARTPIRLGTRMPGAVEVLAGLEPGQTVVRAGHQKLYPGAKVMPVPAGGMQGGPMGGGEPASATPVTATETPDSTPAQAGDGGAK